MGTLSYWGFRTRGFLIRFLHYRMSLSSFEGQDDKFSEISRFEERAIQFEPSCSSSWFAGGVEACDSMCCCLWSVWYIRAYEDSRIGVHSKHP